MTLGLDEAGRIVPIAIETPAEGGKPQARALPYDLTGAFWNILFSKVPPDGLARTLEVSPGNVVAVTIETIASRTAPEAFDPNKPLVFSAPARAPLKVP